MTATHEHFPHEQPSAMRPHLRRPSANGGHGQGDRVGMSASADRNTHEILHESRPLGQPFTDAHRAEQEAPDGSGERQELGDRAYRPDSMYGPYIPARRSIIVDAADAAELTADHENHGGAAGSFASEGCAWCAEDDAAQIVDSEPSGAVRVVTADGRGSLLYATYRARPCGCRVTGNGTLQRPLTVEPCARHEA